MAKEKVVKEVKETVAKEKTAKKKTKRVKKADTEQFEKVEIALGKAPSLSLVFLEKECWKVLPPAKTDSPEMTTVRLWRLCQAGGDQIIEKPATDSVKIQKLYLDSEK